MKDLKTQIMKLNKEVNARKLTDEEFISNLTDILIDKVIELEEKVEKFEREIINLRGRV